MHLITFGPQGTFCHSLAQELTLSIELKNTIGEVCEALCKNEESAALLPIRNSLSGPIEETIAGIETHGFEIVAHYERKIEYVLAGWIHPEEATLILSHPHAKVQCANTLADRCPQAKHIPTFSNAQSALLLLEHRDNAVALTSPKLAALHNLPVLTRNLQDSPDNRTQFVLVKKREVGAAALN